MKKVQVSLFQAKVEGFPNLGCCFHFVSEWWFRQSPTTVRKYAVYRRKKGGGGITRDRCSAGGRTMEQGAIGDPKCWPKKRARFVGSPHAECINFNVKQWNLTIWSIKVTKVTSLMLVQNHLHLLSPVTWSLRPCAVLQPRGRPAARTNIWWRCQTPSQRHSTLCPRKWVGTMGL